MKHKIFSILLLACVVVPAIASCQTRSAYTNAENNDVVDAKQQKGQRGGGPQLGSPGRGPAIDKSGDTLLQAMIKAEVPEFKQFVFSDSTGKNMKYNLYSPKNPEANKKYPLVLFIADASTPGESYEAPLTQGYGALVWATNEWQEVHPCYVLVPQFSGVAVNDKYEHTDEVDIVIRMLHDIVNRNNVDADRLYTTGQSMGGMISMYYNITYPNLFAASVFVDSHWDTSKFDELVKHKFTYITAGEGTKSLICAETLEKVAERENIRYEFGRWSACLPQSEQDSIAEALLEKGAPINIINFTSGSVLPIDGKGSEHMYSFDYAYKLTPVREWLFKQTK